MESLLETILLRNLFLTFKLGISNFKSRSVSKSNSKYFYEKFEVSKIRKKYGCEFLFRLKAWHYFEKFDVKFKILVK